MDRPTRLYYLGGQPGCQPAGSYFSGVPMRDLGEADIAQLTDEQLADAQSAHPTLGPLYSAEPPTAPEAMPVSSGWFGASAAEADGMDETDDGAESDEED